MTARAVPQDLIASALAALTGDRWPIPVASEHVPPSAGLYAIYGDALAWHDLQLDGLPDDPLYVGKAEQSLVSRDLDDHFALRPEARAARTGSSTVRRSFAALLRESLDLHGVPRNLAKPAHFPNYSLADGGDGRLTSWMHARLSIAVWPAPADMTERLVDVETALIVHFAPPINISNNPRKLARLSNARAAMAAEARRWPPTAEAHA